MYACPQEHTRENLHVRTTLTRAENVRLTSQAQLQPHLGTLSGSSEITNQTPFRNTKECAKGTNSSLEASQES